MRRHEIPKAHDGFHYCELQKIASNHNNVRTERTMGIADFLPSLGKIFVLFGEPLDRSYGSDIRVIETTPVLSVEYCPDFIEFKTVNSTYRLRALDDKNLCRKLSQLPVT